MLTELIIDGLPTSLSHFVMLSYFAAQYDYPWCVDDDDDNDDNVLDYDYLVLYYYLSNRLTIIIFPP